MGTTQYSIEVGDKKETLRSQRQPSDKTAPSFLGANAGKSTQKEEAIAMPRLEKLKRQAEREDGQLLILSPDNGSAAALSALAHNLPLSPPTISNPTPNVK